MRRADLIDLVLEALSHYGGKAKIAKVAEYIWRKKKAELELSEPLLYTWQYDMRWAATFLRKKGKIKPADVSPRGVWELT